MINTLCELFQAQSSNPRMKGHHFGACSPAGGSSQVKKHVQMLRQKCLEVRRKDMKKGAAQFHLGSTVQYKYESSM